MLNVMNRPKRLELRMRKVCIGKEKRETQKRATAQKVGLSFVFNPAALQYGPDIEPLQVNQIVFALEFFRMR